MYTIRCHALATDDTDPDGAQMLIEEPVEVIVMRRYSDFRKMLDLITLHLPLIAEEIEKQAPFPSKQVKLFSKGDDYQTVQNRVSSFQIWLRAVCKHPECWQLRELLEFLDDSSTICK